MIPEPAVLDDLLQHRAFTYNASHQDCEDVVIEAYRAGAKAALAEALRPYQRMPAHICRLYEVIDDD
jgi:uncharacterized protein YllA (UPF0747 family)